MSVAESWIISSVSLCRRRGPLDTAGLCIAFRQPGHPGIVVAAVKLWTSTGAPHNLAAAIRGRTAMRATTCIRNAACVVAWDATSRCHAYLMGGDVAFSGDTISFVGRHYDGAVDETIDGSDLMVMPGLIDLHSHPSTEPFYRGVREEHGVPAMYMSG